MAIVDDFHDIARRVNRKAEAIAAVAVATNCGAEAAVRTLQSLGYTYEHTAQMWKPPLGASQFNGTSRPSGVFGMNQGQSMGQQIATRIAQNQQNAANLAAQLHFNAG